MEESQSGPPSQSRRNLLGKISMGFLGLIGASILLKSPLTRDTGKADSSTSKFPGPNSIFHPQSDPRLDPRRKS